MNNSKLVMAALAVFVAAAVISYVPINKCCALISVGHTRTAPSLPVETLPVVDAEDVDIQLYAPDTAEIGELIVLDVSESQATSFAWAVSPETEHFCVAKDRKGAFLSSKEARTYTITVAATNGLGQIEMVQHQIEITNPRRNDLIKPKPVKPRFRGVTAKVYEWVEEVDSPDRKEELKFLASGFWLLADQMVEDGGLNTKKKIFDATQPMIRRTLRNNRAAWQPFLSHLHTHLEDLKDDGDLKSIAQCRKAWQDLATALDKIASME